MHRIRWTALYVIALVTQVAEAADAFTGNDLYRLMRQPTPNPMAVMWVNGFLQGTNVSEAGRAIRDNKTSPPPGELFCMPSQATVGQAHDVIRQFLETRPEERHEHAGVVAALALARVWPCKTP